MGQFAPVVAATLYWRRATGIGVIAGLVAGASVITLLVISPDWRPWPLHAGLYGFAANVAVLVSVSLVTGQHAPHAEDRFLAIARGVR